MIQFQINSRLIRKSKKNIKVLGTALVIILSIISFTFVAFYEDTGIVGNVIGIITMIIDFLGIICIGYELEMSQRIQEAQFIFELNHAFVENDCYAKVYDKLEMADRKKKKVKLKTIEISNYLTFFETMYLLLQEKVIEIEVLDDLFAYRFFIAVHNEIIQKEKLIKTPYNFRNIFLLEKEWMEYRKRKGLGIYKTENCLRNACLKADKTSDYEKICEECGR